MLGADPVPWLSHPTTRRPLAHADYPCSIGRSTTPTSRPAMPQPSPTRGRGAHRAAPRLGGAGKLSGLKPWPSPRTSLPARADGRRPWRQPGDRGAARGDAPQSGGNGRFATLAVSRVDADRRLGRVAVATPTRSPIALIRFRTRRRAGRARRAGAEWKADLAATDPGIAWPCVATQGFRGPGRKADPCPQVTVEALRVFALLPRNGGPRRSWRRRDAPRRVASSRDVAPYSSATVPPLQDREVARRIWYGVLGVLDALGANRSSGRRRGTGRGPPVHRRAGRLPGPPTTSMPPGG